MKKSDTPFSSSLISVVFAGCVFLITSVQAEVRPFVIDSGASSLSLSGTALNIGVQEQGEGSLTTTYSGSIIVDVSEDAVTFVGGSTITANNSGDWQPLADGASGNAPANYGAYANAGFLGSGYAALRNLLFDLKSESIPTLAGSFAADSLEFSFPPSAVSTADYSYTSVLGNGAGTEYLAGRSTNDVAAVGNISVVGEELVLTIPVNYSLILTGEFDATFQVQGQLVARAPNVTPLQFAELQVSPGLLGFSIPTTPGRTYSILGSSDLTAPVEEWSLVDQFVADGASAARDVAVLLAGQQFFILKEE